MPISTFLLLLLVADMDSGSMGEVVTPRPYLVTAVRCVALSMLDVVAEFSQKREWREEFIGQWQEAFTTLIALDKARTAICRRRIILFSQSANSYDANLMISSRAVRFSWTSSMLIIPEVYNYCHS